MHCTGIAIDVERAELFKTELAEFEKTGDIKWVTELSRVQDKSGTSNVYAEMGTSFATTCVIDPKFAAALKQHIDLMPAAKIRPIWK